MPETVPGADGDSAGNGAAPRPVVLLVEDDPDIAAYTGTVLRHLVGAKVVDARSAEIALSRLADTDVDLMATDIELLPGADGLELTAAVRKRYPLLPVVVLSGHATFDHAVVAMRAGASEFLPKPVDPERLATVATALIVQRRRRVAAEAVSVLAISDGAHPDLGLVAVRGVSPNDLRSARLSENTSPGDFQPPQATASPPL
jgi:DNA-binding NtrC family response regulator